MSVSNITTPNLPTWSRFSRQPASISNNLPYPLDRFTPGAPIGGLFPSVLPVPIVPTPEQLSNKAANANYYFELGNSYYQDNQYQKSVEALNKAIEADNRNYLAFHRRGTAKASLKDYVGAINDFTQAILIKPDSYNSYNNRGNVKSALRDYAGAMADYTQAIRLSPMNPVAYENRSELYTVLGMSQPALQDKAMAIRLHKMTATPHVSQSSSFVPKRFALVLGNSDYVGTENDLGDGPLNDAMSMQAALQKDGFEVTSGLNLTADQMKAKISEYTNKLKQYPGAVSLIYYSGHGGSINGNNHLLSTDFTGANTPEIMQSQSVSIDHILRELKQTPTNFNILVFDACRTPLLSAGNFAATGPMIKQWETEAGPGLSNVWIEYASRPMSPAFQNRNNGLYTKYLLEYLNRPDLSLQEVSMYTSYALDQDPLAQKENQHARTQTDLTRTGPIANAFYFAKPLSPIPVTNIPLTYAP